MRLGVSLVVLAALFVSSADVGVIAARSQEPPEFRELLRDASIEAALQLKDKDLGRVAIEVVTALPRLGPQAAGDARVALSRALLGVNIVEVYCAPCDGAPRLVVDVESHKHRRLAQEIGADTFLQVTIEITSEDAERLIMSITAVSASTEQVLAALRIDGSDVRAGLLRTEQKIESVQARTEALQKDVKQRSLFGHAAIVGILRVPYKLSAEGFELKGMLNATTFAYRFYELFGAERRVSFGLQIQGFIDLDFGNNLPMGVLEAGQILSASGAMFSGAFSYTIGPDDLRMPRLRLGALGGAFIGGSLGNNAFGGAIIEMMMRYRFGVNFALLFFGDAKSTIEPVRITIGGLSWMLGGSFNWD